MMETTEKPISETKEAPPGVSETFFARLVGINEAAEISRASKGQLSKDSNAAKIPFILNDKGHRQYRVADLYQKYGFRNQIESSIQEPQKPTEFLPETMQTVIELAVLKERVARLESENADLRSNRDKLFDQNNRLTMLLTAPPPAPATEPAKAQPETPPPSFWQRLFHPKKQ